MSDARLEREYPVSPERLFAAVTQPADLTRWWGPEGTELGAHELDFSRLGPWFTVKTHPDGREMKMSGQVTSYDPPRSVGFTWAWHDENDNRGHESHVTFTIVETAAGARLIIDHRDLQNEEAAKGHTWGWESSTNKIYALFD